MIFCQNLMWWSVLAYIIWILWKITKKLKNDHILVKKNLKLEHVKSGPSADFFLSLILWKPQHLIFIFCWNFHCQLKSNLRPLLERCEWKRIASWWVSKLMTAGQLEGDCNCSRSNRRTAEYEKNVVGRTSGQQPQIATIIAVSPQPNRISANKNDPSMATSIAILILERNDGNVQRQCVWKYVMID